MRVVLQWIEIVHTKEPAWKDRGQFRFSARVTADGTSTAMTFPEDGHYEITDQPPWNRVVLHRVLHEGDVANALIIELAGEELDRATKNDPLEDYSRTFSASPRDWIGAYEESMSNWRIGYAIEAA
jgi:hypothetical protein